MASAPDFFAASAGIAGARRRARSDEDGPNGRGGGPLTPAGGYSGSPLPKKLGVKPGGRLLLLGAPRGWSAGPLPDGARQAAARPAASTPAPQAAGDRADVTIFFARALEALEGAIEPLSQRVFPHGALWIAWPRRAAGHDSDIREQDVRDLALPLGLVDVKVAALGEDWSGLRLVWRTERRGG